MKKTITLTAIRNPGTNFSEPTSLQPGASAAALGATPARQVSSLTFTPTKEKQFFRVHVQ